MQETLIYNVYWEDSAFTAHVHVSCHTDRNYGSDRDGNRGVVRTFIDDVFIIKVIDEKGVELKDIPKGLKNKIISVVDEHI